jgi:hypothetical protein
LRALQIYRAPLLGPYPNPVCHRRSNAFCLLPIISTATSPTRPMTSNSPATVILPTTSSECPAFRLPTLVQNPSHPTIRRACHTFHTHLSHSPGSCRCCCCCYEARRIRAQTWSLTVRNARSGPGDSRDNQKDRLPRLGNRPVLQDPARRHCCLPSHSLRRAPPCSKGVGGLRRSSKDPHGSVKDPTNRRPPHIRDTISDGQPLHIRGIHASYLSLSAWSTSEPEFSFSGAALPLQAVQPGARRAHQRSSKPRGGEGSTRRHRRGGQYCSRRCRREVFTRQGATPIPSLALPCLPFPSSLS